MPSKVITIVIEWMFLGVNMFLALLRAKFNPCLRLGLKWDWAGPKTYLRPRTSSLLSYRTPNVKNGSRTVNSSTIRKQSKFTFCSRDLFISSVGNIILRIQYLVKLPVLYDSFREFPKQKTEDRFAFKLRTVAIKNIGTRCMQELFFDLVTMWHL